VLQAGRDLGVEEALDHLLQVEARSWKHTHGTAMSVLPRQRAFNRLICEGAARRGRLHLMLMYLDDVPIAYDLGITAADRYSYLKTSFDETYRRLSPATVLRAGLVKTLIAEGVRCIDFPAAPFKWEEQWTDTLRRRYSFLAFNRTPRGMLYWLLLRLRDLFRRSPDEEGVQYVDPRKPGLVVEADELAVEGEPCWRGDAAGAPAHSQ
jgi:CelD/BcsL family acetyltransferase involved in cellulose biosynthesis